MISHVIRWIRSLIRHLRPTGSARDTVKRAPAVSRQMIGLDPDDVRLFIVRPALMRLGMHSEAAENLVMGTAAQETHFAYIKQSRGPALGLWQCEPSTHTDHWDSYLRYHHSIAQRLLMAAGNGEDPDTFRPPDDWLTYNLRYAAGICRIHYWRKTQPLPEHDDIEGLAFYWKRWYNTPQGRGTADQFVDNYERFLAD